MPDRDSVINDLNVAKLILCNPQMLTPEMRIRSGQAITSAIALLKEQEAVAVYDPGAYCPKCGWMLYPEDHPHHCGNCGQAVKWE